MAHIENPIHGPTFSQEIKLLRKTTFLIKIQEQTLYIFTQIQLSEINRWLEFESVLPSNGKTHLLQHSTRR
ncbi:hypothetical protein Lalb_Chr20g0108891 [Lupinus albus]|uniref:Uncharacterized protein n=1 Tax=Lupinus albus TaxID=3870 RepID=A0A6A4NT52_LUPAL|nr:hypothetical protein Lalb_Chr20g0108891 [Lupinus albus]